MRTKLNTISYWILLGLACLHLFLLEDTYGTDGAKPSVIYQNFGGITVLDLIVILLAIVFFSEKLRVRISKETQRLFWLIGVALVVSYITAGVRGNLFGGGLGSGLKELRAAIVMSLFYYVFRKTLYDRNRLFAFTRYLGCIIAFSACLHLIQYIFGLGSFISPAYGKLTAFEGPLLVWWVFGFSLFLAHSLVGTDRLPNAGIAFIIAIAIILSFRRMPEFMALFILFIFTAYGLRRLRGAFFAIPAVIGILLISICGKELLPKINPENLFNTSSEEYAKNFSSNRQHANDIIEGWILIQQHFLLGIGPGAVLKSPDPERPFAENAGVHMQYWNFWLRLSFFGLCFLIYFYYIQCKFALITLKNTVSAETTSLALSIFGFTLAAASVASLVGLSIYGSEKLQYLSVYILAAAEIIYIDNKALSARINK